MKNKKALIGQALAGLLLLASGCAHDRSNWLVMVPTRR